MKRFLLVTSGLVIVATPAFAFGWGDIKNYISTELIALAVSMAAGIVSVAIGSKYGKVTKTLKESGQFFNVLGTALEDKKVTREEIAEIVKEGKDVFNIYAKTPNKYSDGFESNPEIPNVR